MAKFLLTKKLRRAAIEQINLQARVWHPSGDFDDAGRWYPTRYCDCCESIRSPSRAFPYSLMVHCRTVSHVAREHGIEERRLRWAVKRLRKDIGAVYEAYRAASDSTDGSLSASVQCDYQLYQNVAGISGVEAVDYSEWINPAKGWNARLPLSTMLSTYL